MESYYKNYLIAQITGDYITAETLWSTISEDVKIQFDKLMLGLNNYRGKHVDSPIGSTWKAHKSLISRVNKLSDDYLNDLANALLASADKLDFMC